MWRSVKYEDVYLKAYESVSHTSRSIGDHLNLCNQKRPIRVYLSRRRMRHASRRCQRSNRQLDGPDVSTHKLDLSA